MSDFFVEEIAILGYDTQFVENAVFKIHFVTLFFDFFAFRRLSLLIPYMKESTRANHKLRHGGDEQKHEPESGFTVIPVIDGLEMDNVSK